VATTPGDLTLYTEPTTGLAPVYGLITSAQRTVDLTMYELVDQTTEDDLAADAARGVTVRVILDHQREGSRNRAAYQYLSAHGVHVVWADPSYDATHQKTLTVDGDTSAIMTLNLVTEDYPDTRDFAVFDTNPADVEAIEQTFRADFAHEPITPPTGTDLVWSPTNALPSILAVVDGASRTLAVENEEMGDRAVTTALEAAAKRGVDVTVAMTAAPEWDRAFAELTASGVHLAIHPDNSSSLYIHAKAIVADVGTPAARAFAGSENFSVASLGHNRELGLVTADTAVVTGLAGTLRSDLVVDDHDNH